MSDQKSNGDKVVVLSFAESVALLDLAVALAVNSRLRECLSKLAQDQVRGLVPIMILPDELLEWAELPENRRKGTGLKADLCSPRL